MHCLDLSQHQRFWLQVPADVVSKVCCSKIAEAEAVVSVNEKKWLVMHIHVQLSLVELQGPPNPWLTVKLPGPLLPSC